jgi:ATP-binding cassette, subfamily B, multidrug efflux pump
MSEKKISGKAFDLTLLKRIFQLVSKYRFFVILTLIFTFLGSVIAVILPIYIQQAFQKYVMAPDTTTHTGLDLSKIENGLLIAAGQYLGLLILQTLFSYWQTFYNGWLGQQAIYHLRTRIFDHILGFRSKVYDNTPVGTLITRSISDVEAVADVFGEGSISIIGDLLLIVFILGVMFFYSWQLSLYTLSVFPLLLIAAYIFKEKVAVSFQDVRTQVARLNAFIQEHITGMQIVQVFNRQKKELDRFEGINAAHRDANIRGIFYYAVFFPVIEVLQAIAVGLIIWGGVKLVLPDYANAKEIASVMVLFIMLINLLFRPVRMIADKFNTLQMGMVAAGRIFTVLDTEDTITDEGKIDRVRVDGSVAFKNVWFAYNDEDWILKDISFEAKLQSLIL